MKKSVSKNERQKTRRFFIFVSAIYPFIERSLDPAYRDALAMLDLDPQLDVLDLATGTGLLAGTFAQRGHKVQGLDFADKLLQQAKKKHPAVSFRSFDLINLPEIPDNSHAIVCMGYLLHGLDAEFRHNILSQAARIASNHVLVFDYGRPGNLFVRFIEWVEGPHYPGFLAASRRDEFSQAGLDILREFEFSQNGQVWLCGAGPS